jgi:hypothetical protein
MITLADSALSEAEWAVLARYAAEVNAYHAASSPGDGVLSLQDVVCALVREAAAKMGKEYARRDAHHAAAVALARSER